MSTLVLKNVRFSYAHVFSPKAMEGSDDKKYSVSIIIDKEDPQVPAIKEAIKQAITEGSAKLGKINAATKQPLRDGDVDRPDDENYAGKYFINASCKTAPGVSKAVLKDDKYVLVAANETEFYSGCYGLASLTFYPFNVSGNKGIAAGLNNVCKTKDGEFLGGRNSAESDFNAILSEIPVEEADDFPF